MKNNTSEIAQIELVEVIDKLSSESSFKNVFHLSHAGLPILSSQVLEQMVELTRSILFPGYFGTFTASKASVKMVSFILMSGFYVNDNFIRLQSYE